MDPGCPELHVIMGIFMNFYSYITKSHKSKAIITYVSGGGGEIGRQVTYTVENSRILRCHLKIF